MKETIALLQGYYSYFLLGLYTDILMKEWKIPLSSELSPDTIPSNKKTITPGKEPQPQTIILKTGERTAIKLNTTRIDKLLEQIKKQPEGRNVYGYLSFISSIKGVFGVFLDMHARYPARRTFLQKTLGKEYTSYIQIVRFCRNLLTHQQSADMTMSKQDKESALFRLTETGKRIVSLSFSYKDIFWAERKWLPTYGFHASINTATLHAKKTLFSIIDQHTLFMLAESVYNISDYYLKQNTAAAKTATEKPIATKTTSSAAKKHSPIAETPSVLGKSIQKTTTPDTRKNTPHTKKTTSTRPSQANATQKKITAKTPASKGKWQHTSQKPRRKTLRTPL